jgi:zinc and cadmium transporter
MDPVLILMLIAVFLVSAISLVGAVTLFFKHKTVGKFLFLAIAFAAGSLLGAAFLDLLPEAMSEGAGAGMLGFTLLGVLVFFVMEKILYWRHCHDEDCKVHNFTYLSLVGDGIHNFIDGMIIAASFIASVPLGVTTTVAIALHEIPQEIGDFSILLHGGMSKGRALLYNFLTALTAVLGALSVYFFAPHVQNLGAVLVPFAAGGFIYIAAADLIPEMHKERDIKRSALQLTMLAAGILVIWLATIYLE